jgi:hypothetical protein
LTDRIFDAVRLITEGRVGLRTKGKAEKGRTYFAQGLQKATAIFTEVQATRDPYMMLLAEYVYVGQELASSRPEEKEARASCEAAMQDFDDAFLALTAMNNHAGYKIADMAFPHRDKYRYKGMPNDAFHIAYIYLVEFAVYRKILPCKLVKPPQNREFLHLLVRKFTSPTGC